MKDLSNDKSSQIKALYELADEETEKGGMMDAKTLKVLKELEEKSDEEALTKAAAQSSADEEDSADDVNADADDDSAVLSEVPAEQIVKGVNEIFALYDDVNLSDIPDEVLVLAKDGNLAAAYGAYRVKQLEGKVKQLVSQLKNSEDDENIKLSMGEIKSTPKSVGLTQQWLNCASTKDIEDNWERIYPLIKSGKLKAF